MKCPHPFVRINKQGQMICGTCGMPVSNFTYYPIPIDIVENSL